MRAEEKEEQLMQNIMAGDTDGDIDDAEGIIQC